MKLLNEENLRSTAGVSRQVFEHVYQRYCGPVTPLRQRCVLVIVVLAIVDTAAMQIHVVPRAVLPQNISYVEASQRHPSKARYPFVSQNVAQSHHLPRQAHAGVGEGCLE